MGRAPPCDNAGMPAALSNQLRNRIDRELPPLEAFTEDQAAVVPATGGWSPKEELGHLIDSAANNHTRFVIAAIGPELRGPGYSQNDWVRLHGYAEMPWQRIVAFWYAYNALLADLIARIPEDRLATVCHVEPYPPATLRFLIEDYGVHLQHHLDHLLSRPFVTPYPPV